LSINPAVRVSIGLNKAAIFAIGRQKHLTFEQVETVILNLIKEVLEDTIHDLEIWIDIHVPKRSGQLRENLKTVIRTSRVVDYMAHIVMGSSLPYAERVNEMPAAWVRHYNTDLEHSGAKAKFAGLPIHLDDPNAEGHFFDKLQDFMQERVYANLIIAKNRAEEGSQLTSRNLSKVGVSA